MTTTTATDANSKITTAMNTAISKFQRNETEVSASATKANNSINNEIAKVAGESSNSVSSIKNKTTEALTSIAEEKKRAFQRLDVNNLPNLAALKCQIAELQRTGSKLNLWNIKCFVGYSWWIMLAAILITFVMSLIALVIAARH